MKITKKQLQKIIKEELQRVLEAQVGRDDDPATLDADDLRATAAELEDESEDEDYDDEWSFYGDKFGWDEEDTKHYRETDWG